VIDKYKLKQINELKKEFDNAKRFLYWRNHRLKVIKETKRYILSFPMGETREELEIEYKYVQEALEKHCNNLRAELKDLGYIELE